MSGPPSHKPKRPVLLFSELSSNNGWAWFFKRPVGSGHLILASSVGNGRFETREAAVENFRRFQQEIAGMEAK